MLKRFKWWLEDWGPILFLFAVAVLLVWIVASFASYKGDGSYEAVTNAQFVLYGDDGKMYALPDQGVVVDMDEGVQYIYVDGEIVSPRYKRDGTIYTMTE